MELETSRCRARRGILFILSGVGLAGLVLYQVFASSIGSIFVET